MNKKAVGIIVILIAGSVVGGAIMQSMEGGGDDAPGGGGAGPAGQGEAPGLQGEVRLGLLTPLTEDLAYQGSESVEAANLAASEFNRYLEVIGEEWFVSMAVEDTQTKPTVALEKLTSLNAKGISLVIGPESSASIRNIKGYADSNNMLLVSCCSTAPALSIAGDNVYRLIPDDLKQGRAVGKLLSASGIEAVVPIWRGDTWGDGLAASSVESFEARGGTADEGIRYNPEAVEFSASASLLADRVQAYVDEYGADKVGVLTIGFGETLPLMQSAASHGVLDDVRWFGSDGLASDPRITDDPIGSKFATDVSLTTTLFAVVENPKYDEVSATLTENLGWTPKTYAYVVYDAVWLTGLSILEAQSTDADDVKAVIDDVAWEYIGAIGDIQLNEAGDLASSNYDLWGVRDGQWSAVGTWSHVDDSITITN